MKGKLHIYSNIAYLIGGFLIGHPLFILTMAILAFTSFMGHWKGGKWWIMDWVGMYLVFSSIIFFHLGIVPFWFIVAPLLSVLAYIYHKESFVRIGLFWLGATVTAFFVGVNIIPSVIVFGLALFIRQLTPNMDDKYYDVCHSIWHVLSMVGITLLII